MSNASVIIWEADGEPIPGIGYGSRLAERLAAHGFNCHIVPRYRRPLTPEESSSTFHILTGGATSVHHAGSWMTDALRELSSLLDRARRAEAIVIGICLGSQMLAQVLLKDQPATRISERGIEVGFHEVRDLTTGRTHRGVGQFHYEEILPAILTVPGVMHTHTNDHSVVQGFGIGDRIFGLQGHPEFSPDDMQQLIDHNAETIERFGGNPRHLLSDVERRMEHWSPDTFDELVISRLRIEPPTDDAPKA
jgi:GMP synthase-like glutamine amidotransferase